MLKKIFCIAMALVSVFGFSACSKNKWEDELLNRNKPLNLMVWTYYNDASAAPFDDLVAEFNNSEGKKYNIIVNKRHFSNIGGIAAEIARAAAGTDVGAPDMPNMFMCYPDDCWDIDREYGKVAALDKYITAAELDAYVPAFLNEGRYDAGALKILPLAKSTELFTMNKTDWELFQTAYNAAHPEKPVQTDDLATIEGIIEVAEKYYDFTGGKAFYGRDAMANYVVSGMEMLGGRLFSQKEGKTVADMDKTAMRKLFDSHFVPMVKGYFCAEGSFRSDDIKNKKLLAATASSSSINFFPTEINVSQTEKKGIDALITSAPGFRGKQTVVMQQGGGIAVTKKTELEEYASTKFLRWLTAPEQNMKFSVESGYAPVTKEGLSKDKLLKLIPTDEGAAATAQKKIQNTRAGLSASVDSFKNLKTTYLAPFENSNAARTVFDWALQNKNARTEDKPAALTAAGLINANDALVMIKAGVKTQEYFLTEEFFNDWFAKLTAALNATLAA